MSVGVAGVRERRDVGARVRVRGEKVIIRQRVPKYTHRQPCWLKFFFEMATFIHSVSLVGFYRKGPRESCGKQNTLCEFPRLLTKMWFSRRQ